MGGSRPLSGRGWEGLPSVVLSGVGIRYTEMHIDCDPDPVEEPADVCRILLIHDTRLVPDHHLAEAFDEVIDLGPPEMLRHDEVVEVVGGTVEGLLRGQAEVP